MTDWTVIEGVSRECFDWCLTQHFINDYQALWLLIAAFCVLGFSMFMYLNGERFKAHANMTDEKIASIIMTCVFISFVLLLSFFIMWKYF